MRAQKEIHARTVLDCRGEQNLFENIRLAHLNLSLTQIKSYWNSNLESDNEGIIE